jgi:deoxyribonuclease V
MPAGSSRERDCRSREVSTYAEGGLSGRIEREPIAIALSCVVVIDTETGAVVEKTYAASPVYFPYVPGFLSFREGPAVLKAIGELKKLPSVMVYDGCGIAHPRGLGLASHMSILTGIPSVGCAKSKLCGTCEEPNTVRGSWTPVVFQDETVGVCLRTRNNVRPVFVSPGSGFDVQGAREVVERLIHGYRLPEPTRLAHKYVTQYKKELLGRKRIPAGPKC